MTSTRPSLSVIIVSYNTCDLLDACLRSVYRWTTGISIEVIVVDNASHDHSASMMRSLYPKAVLIESGENLGFGPANNLGFSRAQAPYIMLLNSDALLLEDAGSALVHFLEEHPQAGIVGPEVVLMDGTRQPKTCGLLPTIRVMLNHHFLLCRAFPRSRFFAGLYLENRESRVARIGWISGVCMVIRREAYEQAKGFDPKIFMYVEDIDLCCRCATLGWETWRINTCTIKHLCGGSTKSSEQRLRIHLMQQRNLLKLLDVCMSPVGRTLSRWGLFVGLLARIAARGLVWPLSSADHRLAFSGDLRCLADLLGFHSRPPENRHAHRA